MYYGHRFEAVGRYYAADTLSSVEDVWGYVLKVLDSEYKVVDWRIPLTWLPNY